ncbi:MAG: glycosyltransferase family 4 protein [Pseudomonadota bacterium]
MRLVFADNSFAYDGSTPENEPLGGSHSALVYLCRALADLGHDVHVYNKCPSPGLFHGVHYHRFEEVTEANKFLYADAFISLRNPSIFRFWINAGVRILWAHDAVDQPVLNGLGTDENLRRNIDSIFCVSKWQAWTYLKYFGWPSEKIFVTRDAIWPDHYPKELPGPCGHRLVYTSTPFRGLELLLLLFPEIRQSVTDAELHVFSSMKVYQQNEEDDRKQNGAIYEMARQPGVFMHGSVGQRHLARELAKATVFAYPNTFPETGCISAMEALAAGCVAVTSNLAALPETVGPGGLLIEGIPGTPAYNRAFVDSCIRLLKDEEARRKLAGAGRDWILSRFTWDKVAGEWSVQIDKMIEADRWRIDNFASAKRMDHSSPFQ